MLDNETGLTEETARAMRAVASTVTDAPPLRLAPRPGYRAARPAPRRRWQRWGVPLAAALTVIAVAVALVTARDASPRRVAPPASPALTVDGVPAYYAALVTAGSAQTAPEQIAIGETVTGKRIATVAPPAGTTFTGVTGAADDRTFVVDAQPGSLDAESEPFAPRTWYLLRISPGAADPAQLTRLPIPATAPGTDVAAVALSPDGAELAVGLQPNALNDPGGPVYLRVYSVASGAVLHSWSSVGGGVLADGQLFGGPKYAGPDPNLALAWIGQQGLAFGYRRGVPGKTIDGSQVSSPQVTLAQIRFIALSAKDGGDLVAESKMLASMVPAQARPTPAPLDCGVPALGGIVIADHGLTPAGPTLLCGATGVYRYPGGTEGRLGCVSQPAFRLGLVEYEAGAKAPSRVLAQYASRCRSPQVLLQPLWSNSAGTVQLGMLGLGTGGSSEEPRLGVFDKGAFKPIPLPTTGAAGTADPEPLDYIAW
jgi:hypothetical protein